MSPALKVLAPGLHTTVQDRGRFGYQQFGMPVAGPLDLASFWLANALVGNHVDATALEVLVQGPTLEVAAESVRVALTGTSAPIEILGTASRRVAPWRSMQLARGTAFRVGSFADSACAYLAVEGSFDIACPLGSRATYVRGAVGGLEGRPLRAGDTLPLQLNRVEARGETALPHPPGPGLDQEIRVVLGPQHDHFTDAALKTFLSAAFRISAQSDRMGYRLEGPALAHCKGYDIVSDGVVCGSIQVPGSGQPIVLLADRQTTGGYPKIATVIWADLPILGRRRPGSVVRFTAVDVATAEEIARHRYAELQRLATQRRPFADRSDIDLASLYTANLISGVVDAGA